jgi:hypothetical protein
MKTYHQMTPLEIFEYVRAACRTHRGRNIGPNLLVSVWGYPHPTGPLSSYLTTPFNDRMVVTSIVATCTLAPPGTPISHLWAAFPLGTQPVSRWYRD